MNLQTSYEFTLPRGYVDDDGVLHRTGTMRLATARDELDPLRDPRITGPDDPRLTILVLARVLEKLGTVELINTHVVEGLFAVDLAFLQDFYGVINFGDQDEYEALIAASQGRPLTGTPREAAPAAAPAATGSSGSAGSPGPSGPVASAPEPPEGLAPPRPSLRAAVEELPRRTS